METQTNDKPVEETTAELIRLIEEMGLAYIHSSGCAVLKNGRWIQPGEWEELMQRMEKSC